MRRASVPRARAPYELHFSAATQTGVVFHMLAGLSERGTMGLTAVGDSPAQARALFDRTLATLDEETAAAS